MLLNFWRQNLQSNFGPEIFLREGGGFDGAA